jgi:uncharacterized membrane protein YhaH (DUF805 family)
LILSLAKVPDMTMQQAVRTVLSKYTVFSGRAGRSEFWWWVLFQFVCALIANFIDAILFRRAPILSALVSLGLLLPALGVTIRRLHDADKSGFWLFISLIPFIGALVLLFFYVQPSVPGTNRFGEAPENVAVLV